MPPRTKPGKPSPLPDFIPPELATLTNKAPAGDEWVHEIKLDGYRTAARLEAGKVRMLTRSGRLDGALPANRCGPGGPQDPRGLSGWQDRRDGEDGVTSFAALQDALKRRQPGRLTYHVFDLPHLDGRDITSLALVECKRALAATPRLVAIAPPQALPAAPV